MPIQAQGQVQNVDGQEKQRHEYQPLNPPFVADMFGDVSKLRRPAQPKNQKKEKPSKKIRNEVKRVARPRVRYRLRLALMRKRVLFGPCLFRSLRFRRRTLRGSGLRRRGLRGRCLRMRGRRKVRRTARSYRETYRRTKNQRETVMGNSPSHKTISPISQRRFSCSSVESQHGPRVCRTAIRTARLHLVVLDVGNEGAFPTC